MKRFSLILGLMSVAAVSGGNAFAAGIATPCPTTFTCAFGAAEVRPLEDPTAPGAPSVFLGYLSFDGSATPTLYSLGNLNGTLQTLVTATGTCTPGVSSAPGTLDFGANAPKFAFVSDHGATELRAMIIADPNGVTPSAVNLGTCTEQ